MRAAGDDEAPAARPAPPRSYGSAFAPDSEVDDDIQLPDEREGAIEGDGDGDGEGNRQGADAAPAKKRRRRRRKPSGGGDAGADNSGDAAARD